MNAKDYAAEWKWMNSSEAKQRSAAAKAQALSDFKKRFPRADMCKFIAQAEFDANRKATARVLFPDGDGSWENALIEDSKYWSQPLKDALGMQQDGGFPYQLSLLQQDKPQPVPAIAFSDSIAQSVGDLFDKQVKIYVTPTEYFTTKFRQIFTKTQIKFTTAKYARKWLAKPDMSFWPQQLNFALWCATTGCGVSREMLFSNSTLNLSEQIRTFFQFHVGYTTRKILYEMGGIQSKNALPDDPAFNQQENPYDVASYKRLCAEFGIDPSTDFRFTYGQSHGLGYVNIIYSDGPFAQKQWKYPPADLSNPSSQRRARLVTLSTRKATTARMISQVCLPRKEMTEPAVLNMKPTIDPIKPGRAAAAFLPSSLSPLLTALVAFARPFKVVSTTALMTMPAARTIACSVQPYFLKISRILSRKGRTCSLS